MKSAVILLSFLSILFFIFQIYTFMAINKTEMQPYTVIQKDGQFEIRFYPSTLMARISSSTKSYRDLGYSGFSKLAKYISGANSENKKISMTSPVHMDIGDTTSTMSFVMPIDLKKEDLPFPDNTQIQIHSSEPEYVASLTFGGFASTAKINKEKDRLKKLLKEKGISYFGNFRFLGYNPPYQLLGRRNEVIVSIKFGDL